MLPSLAVANPTPADKKRAGELAAESAKAYKRGELEVSVALLRQAYALYPQPNLLYNLARALEGLGDKQGALDAYTRYLAEGRQVEDRGAIERRIETLQAELKAQAKLTAKPVEPNPPRPEPDPEPTPLPEPPPPQAPTVDGPSKLPWLPIVAGVGVLAGGGAFAYLARDREDQASAALIGLE
ncbi:MAG: hypothetical protein H0T42_19660, partial [Deltaproteobacteria bacterium]|nr:hypothetical protein [Deltaproteobacteria bacterium]